MQKAQRKKFDPNETVPCKYCTKPTRMLGTKLCDGCWETDRQLDFVGDLAKTKAGITRLREVRDHINAILGKAT
jgi:hypothetical protein